MPPANDHGAVTGRAAVDRQLLDAARHRAGGPTPIVDGHWTACSAPGRIAAVDADGGLRACEFAAVALGDAGGSLAALWAAAQRELGTPLADGQLPLPHCQGCAAWCAADLHAAAPMVRDYGVPLPAGAPAGPTAVLRLDAAGQHRRGADEALFAELSQCATVVVEGPDVLGSPVAMAWLGRWRDAATRPRLVIRTRLLPAADEVAARLAGAPLDRLELDLELADEPTIAALGAAAPRLGARAAVRFTLTPSGWFDFEPVVAAAAAHGASVELRVLDRDARCPLDSLSVEQASLVRDAVADCWPRLHGEARPASIGDGDFDRLCQELRALVGRRVEAAHGDAAPTPPMALPPLRHHWHQGPGAATWLTRLFWRAHTPLVREWVLAITDADRLREHPWLRALAHRIAYETQAERLLAELRRAYGNAAQQRQLAAEDRRFAEELGLRRFGGPWDRRIGLGAPRRRARPFPLGEPSPVAADATADVTVLIPSYRHAKFITETLQSVLAQRDVNFRVLVADDRSPDQTAARARAVRDPRLEVRVNERNVGLGNSVLQALEGIDTEFVALLNSDDLLHPEHLATCRRALLDDPTASLVCTDIQPVDARGGQLDPEHVSLVHDGKQVLDWIGWFARSSPRSEVPRQRVFGELLERNYLVTSSNLFARTAWLRRQAAALQSLKYCLDWRLFLQAAAENALLHLRRPLIAYRLHGSNTVWFDPDRRYSYYLEVNRVVADALHQFAAHHPDPRASVERVLEAVAHHVSRNGEVDGYALFLNAALDALQLDRLAVESPRAQELMRELSAAADRRRLGERAPAATEAQMLGLELEHLRSLLGAERGQRRWLQVASDHQAERLARTEAVNREIWADKQRLEQASRELEQRLAAAHENLQAVARARDEREAELRRTSGERDELRGLKERLAAALAEEQQRLRQRTEALAALSAQAAALREDLANARAAGERLGAQLAATETQLTASRADLTAERQAHAATQAGLAAEREAHAATAASLAATNQQLAGLRADLERSRHDFAAERRQLATSRTGAATLRGELHATREALRDARQQAAAARAEAARLAASREHRLGDFLWNRLPTGSLLRRLQKWRGKALDARTRFSLRRLGEPTGLGRAIVASTWSWPIYSHTFVYQEVCGLLDAGLDVRMFHWAKETPARLHAAFAALGPRSVQLQTVWSNHLKDRAWFERTRPQRFAAFLDRVAALTGRTAADLREDAMILRSCTFARLVELSGADYLHSYFFYDMSFMAMMAAWLLELPRGMTCYADHMLDDYPWKLVPLHLELCDVLVATSERVKGELSLLSGGRCDARILVKPNGVDGRRFPPAERPARTAQQPFELLAVSRIEPKKGLLQLVDAVARLVARRLPVTLHVVGDADPHSPGSIDYAREFEQRIRDRGVGGHVVRHGALQQEQLPPLFARCHAFVAPYVETATGDKDGIPTSLLEAMSSQLPIVASDSGSIPEALTDGEHALLVRQGDAAGLAKAIERLAGDPALGSRLAAAARRRFDAEFDARVTERRLHERLRAVLAARK